MTDTLATQLETISGLWAQETQEAIDELTEMRTKLIQNVTTALTIIDGNLNSLSTGIHTRLKRLGEVTEKYELDLEAIASKLRAEERDLRVETYASANGEEKEYRWRIVHASNGENMGDGEGYVNKEDRDHAVSVLFPDVEVTEVTE